MGESWCNMCEFCDFGIERKAIIDKQIDCGFLGGINISLAIDNDYSLDSNNCCSQNNVNCGNT